MKRTNDTRNSCELDISQARLSRQKISSSNAGSPKEVTGWMGALQAQDYAMSKWALGIRSRGSSEKNINEAINSGSIIRTHVLRPTWHFVSQEDLRWMLELTSSRIRAAMKSFDRQQELDEKTFIKCNRVIEKCLMDSGHLTREELIADLTNAKVPIYKNRASHIFMHAEIDGLICSGREKEGKPTFALLDERVPKSKKISRDEALRNLALRYFRSHGPATLQDFNWWSGLSLADSRLGLNLAASGLQVESIRGQEYWFDPSNGCGEIDDETAYFLPAYDEFIISYRSREHSLEASDHKHAVSANGIFYPVIVFRGKVAGTWKRILKNNHVMITASLFRKADRSFARILEKSVSAYSEFLNRKVKLLVKE